MVPFSPDDTINHATTLQGGCSPNVNLALDDPREWCEANRDTEWACGCDAPGSWVGQDTFVGFWSMVYWCSQFLTWLALPVTEAYMSAGDFTFGAKLKAALREQLMVYGSLLGVGICVYIYLTVHEGMRTGAIKTTAMMASNMWGLFMVILLLGYGLVDTPRRLWRVRSIKYELHTMQFRASKLYAEIADATGGGEDIEEEIKQVANQVTKSSSLRQYVDIIMGRAQLESKYSEYTPNATDDLVTQDTLAKLNKRLIKSRRVLNRCQCQWNALMDEVRYSPLCRACACVMCECYCRLVRGFGRCVGA